MSQTSQGPSAEDKRAQAEGALTEVLRLMGLPGRLDAKDAADGSISIALHFEGEVQGVQAGKRSQLIDAIQFLVNKMVNKPNAERRWVNLGVGAHPEPRAPRPPAPAPAPAPTAATAAPAASPAPRAAPPARPPKAAPAPTESTVEAPADPELARLGRALAEKSAKLGRYYAVAPMVLEDRARLMRAAEGVKGVSVKAEGEGRNRRVVYVPDNPAPMPKKGILAEYEDEDEDGDEELED
jgi:predicted RNA-binding protein Jag